MLSRLRFLFLGVSFAASAMLASCIGDDATSRGGAGAETVLSLHPPTWFEDGWSVAKLSFDGRRILFGARFGLRMYDAASGTELDEELGRGLDRVEGGAFHAGGIARRGSRGRLGGWYMEEDGILQFTGLPPDADPTFSPFGFAVAYYRGSGGLGYGLYLGSTEGAGRVPIEESVTGIAWSPDGRTVYATHGSHDGLSSLVAVDAASGRLSTVAEDLDTPWRFNGIGVSPDGGSLFLALTGTTPPDPEVRHRPGADRDLDIYELDLATGEIEPRVQSPGDDFYPVVADGHLYWTHNDFRDDIVVIPVGGGEPRVVVENAQIPYWNHDGSQIGFTVGGWVVADWGLNLDAAVVDVDGDMQATSDPRPIVVGYHEDFTPAWSPDGRWIAYHSHRSDGPVTSYSAEGSTDDLYLRSATDLEAPEIRLTDFGWEVGMADWSPDGTRLVFDSWEPEMPDVSKPWIVTIDPQSGTPMGAERLPVPDDLKGTLLAAWSPDGDIIAAVERMEGNDQAIWLIRVDGSGGERVHEFQASTYGGVDWTPDGQLLIYGALADGRMHLFSVPAAGGEPRQLTSGGDDYVQPQVSPDGRWIAATRMRHVKEVRRLPLRPR